jgi:hypothetical protein
LLAQRLLAAMSDLNEIMTDLALNNVLPNLVEGRLRHKQIHLCTA